MLFESFFFWIIALTFIEFIVIVFIVILLFFTKFVQNMTKRKKNREKKELKELLVATFNEKEKMPEAIFSKKKIHPHALLEVLEDLNSKLNAAHWDQLKEDLLKKYLLPKALRYVKNHNWCKRNFSVRCFSLLPNETEEDLYILLIQDSIPIIQISAAYCIVKISTPKSLHAFFEVISKTAERSHYAFLDIILRNGSTKTFDWIKEQLATKINNNKKYLFIDILKNKFDRAILPFIKQDLKSSNNEIRLKAIKILLTIPEAQMDKLILPFLKDNYFLIRAEIIKNLPTLLKENADIHLKKALNDPEYWVQLSAALTLKKMGDNGISYLSEQVKNKTPLSEISSYVLDLEG